MFVVLFLLNYFWQDISILAVVVKIIVGSGVYFFMLRFVVRDGFLISEAGRALNKILHR